MKFEEWLSQQDGAVEVDCGCVTTEAFYHWLRRAYVAGNSPVIPEGYVMVPEKAMTPKMIIAVQMNTELGSYAAANLVSAYRLFDEFWSEACRAAQQEVIHG